MAINAAGNAAIAPEVRAFNLEANPVSRTAANKHFNREAKKSLNTREMRTYWRLIENVNGTQGAALRLHLLLGAPRMQQLVRATSASLGGDEALMLVDLKGRSATPRPYELPLHEAVTREIEALRTNSPYLFSTNGGGTPLANTTLSNWAKAIVGETIANFRLKRVRSGVETLLASLGVSDKVRGRLQSHGFGGVQDKNYNAHDYVEEYEALEALHQALTSAAIPKRIQRLRAGSSAGGGKKAP